MHYIAKLFMNGRSQAVRLPADLRFDCDSVYIRKDPVTGDVILSKRPVSWDHFFELVDANTNNIPEDFLADRDLDSPPKRDLF